MSNESLVGRWEVAIAGIPKEIHPLLVPKMWVELTLEGPTSPGRVAAIAFAQITGWSVCVGADQAFSRVQLANPTLGKLGLVMATLSIGTRIMRLPDSTRAILSGQTRRCLEPVSHEVSGVLEDGTFAPREQSRTSQLLDGVLALRFG